MSRLATFIYVLTAFSLVLIAVPSVIASGNLRTAALTGQLAPGTGSGVSFSGFDFAVPALNNNGETAFTALLTGAGTSASNDAGLWSEGGSGPLRLVARTGSQAPGMAPGVNFTSISFNFRLQQNGLVINDLGQTAFIGTAGVTGIWSEGSGSLAMEARAGAQAPGTPAGVNFNLFDISPGTVGLLLDNNGRVGFPAALSGAGVTSSNNTGIWRGGGGIPLSLAARQGNSAPGTTANFGAFSGINGPVMNNLGQTAFTVPLTGSGVTGTNASTVWSERGGSLALIARAGNQAPGVPAGVNFQSMTFHPSQNDSGHVGFTATLTGPGVTSVNDLGVWVDRGSGLELVARKGSPAPGTGTGVNFAVRFSERVMNSRGEMAFVGALDGTGVNFGNDTGIWSEGGGQGLHLVARSGDPAPDLAGQVIGSIQASAGPIINSSGMTAFVAPLNDINGPFAIFAQDRTGVLRLIAREGGLLDVSDDPLTSDFRTVSQLAFANHSGNEDGRRSGFNDLGQLAFAAVFTDGSQGIFVSDVATVPEPSTLLLLAVMALLTPPHHRVAAKNRC